jgi:hypothetical protein
MTQFVPFLYTTPSGKDSVAIFDNLLKNKTFSSLDAPQFSCATYKEISVRNITELNVSSATNKARAGGVDMKNIDGLRAEFIKGYRVDSFPPVLMTLPDGTEELWDGYNRYSACKIIGIDTFPLAIYTLNEEWEDRIEEAYYIVSLGLNNHAQCKPASEQDFITCGVIMVQNHSGEMSKQDINNWVNGIRHSWTKKQVDKIVNSIYQKTVVATNITSYPNPKDASSWVSDYVKTSKDPEILCSKESGYALKLYRKIIGEVLSNDEGSTDPTPIVLYTKGSSKIPCDTAEKVENQRKSIIATMKSLDSMFLEFGIKYAAMRAANPNYVPYEIIGALPQLNGVEDMDSLVRIDVDSITKNVEDKV